MEAPIEPPPCSSPFSTRANGCHYYWRGAGPGQASTAIAVFCSRTEQWSLKPTTGPPPPGEWCGCSVHVDGYLYTFGGSNGTSRVNDMSKLDLDSFQWIQLQSSGSQPLKKTGCGLVCVNDRTLCCFGGFGIVPKQPESTCTTNEGELRSTNELHFLDVQTGKLMMCALVKILHRGVPLVKIVYPFIDSCFGSILIFMTELCHNFISGIFKTVQRELLCFWSLIITVILL